MKKIICNINNTNLQKEIVINVSKISSNQDLKTIISHEFQLKENQFSIKNLHSNDQINDINKEYKLLITIIKSNPNIIFIFENKEQILLRNCNNKDFYGIIKQFEEQKVYFSEYCIKNTLKFIVWGIEIPKKNFQFTCIPEGTFVYVENTIPLNYKHLKFIFGPNEIVGIADNFIKSKLNDCHLCGIFSGIDYKYINRSKKLNKRWKYCILTKHLFHFISHFRQTYLNLDYFTTVSEIKQILSYALCDENELKPDDIIVFDQYKNKIDDNCFLIDIKNYKGIEFDILYDKNSNNQFDINNINPIYNNIKKNKFKDDHFQQNKIKDDHFQQNKIKDDHFQQNKNKNDHFQQNKFKDDHYQQKNDNNHGGTPIIIKNESSKQYLTIKFIFEQNPEITFKKTLSTDTKISDISAMISKTYQIRDKIDIKYAVRKTKVSIDREMNVDDVRDEMRIRCEDGRYENVLYIGIRPIKSQKDGERERGEREKGTKKEDRDERHQKPPKKNKDEVMRKIRPMESKSDDDNEKSGNDSQSDEKQPKIKSDKKVKANKKISDDDDFDENEKHSKSPKKAKDKNMKKINEKKHKNDESGDDDFDENEKHSKSPKKTKDKNMKNIKKKKHENEESGDDDFDENIKKGKTYKYFYQTNIDSNIYEVELDSEAKVISMKKVIADKNGIDNLANIKILFAGKDLLNNIVLKSLKVESNILFVYIRSQEDILLMTAKALRVSTVHF